MLANDFACGNYLVFPNGVGLAGFMSRVAELSGQPDVRIRRSYHPEKGLLYFLDKTPPASSTALVPEALVRMRPIASETDTASLLRAAKSERDPFGAFDVYRFHALMVEYTPTGLERICTSVIRRAAEELNAHGN